jgi:UTP-glucose-1-phosphate uridylyltransferase
VGEAPSNLAIAARYALSPDIFDYIARTPPGKNGEIQLTDAMRLMLKDRAMYGVVLEGQRFDIGNKLDFLRTNVVFGLNHPELGAEFRWHDRFRIPGSRWFRCRFRRRFRDHSHHARRPGGSGGAGG